MTVIDRRLLEHAVPIREKMRAEERPDLLASQQELAGAYQADGHVGKVVELLEHVAAVEARVLRDGHRSRLVLQNTLAAMCTELASNR
jgi:hypothetical protein